MIRRNKLFNPPAKAPKTRAVKGDHTLLPHSPLFSVNIITIFAIVIALSTTDQIYNFYKERVEGRVFPR